MARSCPHLPYVGGALKQSAEEISSIRLWKTSPPQFVSANSCLACEAHPSSALSATCSAVDRQQLPFHPVILAAVQLHTVRQIMVLLNRNLFIYSKNTYLRIIGTVILLYHLGLCCHDQLGYSLHSHNTCMSFHTTAMKGHSACQAQLKPRLRIKRHTLVCRRSGHGKC